MSETGARRRSGQWPGQVWLPAALSVKYPAAPLALGWQYVFAAPGFSVDPRSGAVRRHHVDAKRIQRAVKRAAAQAGIFKTVSPHTLRHYLPFLTMSCDLDEHS